MNTAEVLSTKLAEELTSTTNMNSSIYAIAGADSRLETTAITVPTTANTGELGIDLKEFTCFGRLPTEMKLKIWKLVAHEPRVLDIWTRPYNHKIASTGQTLRYRSNIPRPALLGVCHQSRTEGLKHYELAFDSIRGEVGPCPVPASSCSCEEVGEQGTIYVNWDADTILLTYNAVSGGLNPSNDCYLSKSTLFAAHPRMQRLVLLKNAPDDSYFAMHMLNLKELSYFTQSKVLSRLSKATYSQRTTLKLVDIAEDDRMPLEYRSTTARYTIVRVRDYLAYHYKQNEGGQWFHNDRASEGSHCNESDFYFKRHHDRMNTADPETMDMCRSSEEYRNIEHQREKEGWPKKVYGADWKPPVLRLVTIEVAE